MFVWRLLHRLYDLAGLKAIGETISLNALSDSQIRRIYLMEDTGSEFHIPKIEMNAVEDISLEGS